MESRIESCSDDSALMAAIEKAIVAQPDTVEKVRRNIPAAKYSSVPS